MCCCFMAGQALSYSKPFHRQMYGVVCLMAGEHGLEVLASPLAAARICIDKQMLSFGGCQLFMSRCHKIANG